MITQIGKETDRTRKEYYEYMSIVYEEISDFLRERDGAVNPQKLELMFEKTASPYVYWLKENQERQVQKEMNPEARKTLLKSLERKYHLISEDGKYFITGILSSDDFRRLNENMKIAGYRYDSKDRAFVRDVR